MLQIDNDAIYITRGDDAMFRMVLKLNGEVYKMSKGDVMTLTVRATPEDTSPILAEVTTQNDVFTLQHADTADIPAGSYSADIQLEQVNGKRTTVWPTIVGSNRTRIHNFKNFNVMPEVTSK